MKPRAPRESRVKRAPPRTPQSPGLQLLRLPRRSPTLHRRLPTPRFGKSFSFKPEFNSSASATPSPESDPGSALMDIDTAPVKENRRIYNWPSMELVERQDLSSGSVYILLETGEGGEVSKAKDENWEQVCSRFLECISQKPVYVVKEGEEPHEFWELFCSSE